MAALRRRRSRHRPQVERHAPALRVLFADMARATKKLDDLAVLLEKTGGDPRRLEAVKKAQGFRRSWIELAETLCMVRKKGAFRKWGYDDFFVYCKQELTLNKATVEKLTISFSTLKRHAPQVLARDGVAKTIPSYEAIDYYAKVMGDGETDEDVPDAPQKSRLGKLAPPRVSAGVMEELSSAVFDEGQPVAQLRKRFDSVIFPKPKGADQLAALQKASGAARKLAEMLPDLDGVDEKLHSRLERDLGQLRELLEAQAAPLREKLKKTSRRASSPRSKAPAHTEAMN